MKAYILIVLFVIAGSVYGASALVDRVEQIEITHQCY